MQCVLCGIIGMYIAVGLSKEALQYAQGSLKVSIVPCPSNLPLGEFDNRFSQIGDTSFKDSGLCEHHLTKVLMCLC